MSKPQKSARFKYRLETVLKVRELKEKQEQDKFQEECRNVEREEKKEEALKHQQVTEYTELRQIMREAPDLQQITMRKAHLDVLKTQIEEQEKKTEEARKKKEAQRQKLVQAIKEKKIIEKDKEKTKEAWKKLMDKEFGKFLDDISSVRYELNRRGEVDV